MTPDEARQRAVEAAALAIADGVCSVPFSARVACIHGVEFCDCRHWATRAMREFETALWQPIETAPRDGTRVLVFAPAAGSEYPANTQRVDRWHNGGWWQMRPAQPYTHWRPLPAGPGDGA